MRRLGTFVLMMAFLPTLAMSTTDRDLRSRITIDGDLSDFDGDEWILDPSTTFPEPTGDSRWGSDNDIRAIALTWDDFNLYVGVDASTWHTTLMLFIDSACQGVGDFARIDVFSRNIEVSTITPNFLLDVRRTAPIPRFGYIDCNTPLHLVDPDLVPSAYRQEGNTSGGLELAIPWNLLGDFTETQPGTEVPVPGYSLALLSVVSGSVGTGVGDAAPNPSTVLPNDSLRLAPLNNYITVPLDADQDGMLDVGVAPRSIVSYALSTTADVGSVVPLQLKVQAKVFAPDNGENLLFNVWLDDATYPQPVYLTAAVYSADGQLLRNLYQNLPRNLVGGSPVWDQWDGKNNDGAIVPGGIYVLAVTGGPGADTVTQTVKASCAVIR